MVPSSILATYLTAVTDGNNCQQWLNLTDQTLQGYLLAASDAITLLMQKNGSYHDPSILAHKHPKTLTMILEIIRQWATWSTP
jgi:hypothetical protein